MKKLYLVILIFISSCSDHSILYYNGEEPKINLREFFDGKIYALGIVQDRSGKVIKRFKVDIKAFWEGNKGYLDEKFVYSDGKKDSRLWELNKIGQSKYEGRAEDVLGIASGETLGNVVKSELGKKLQKSAKRRKEKIAANKASMTNLRGYTPDVQKVKQVKEGVKTDIADMKKLWSYNKNTQ